MEELYWSAKYHDDMTMFTDI